MEVTMYNSNVQGDFCTSGTLHSLNMTRPENKLSKASSSSFVYDRYVYDKVCIGIPMSIETRTDIEA